VVRQVIILELTITSISGDWLRPSLCSASFENGDNVHFSNK